MRRAKRRKTTAETSLKPQLSPIDHRPVSRAVRFMDIGAASSSVRDLTFGALANLRGQAEMGSVSPAPLTYPTLSTRSRGDKLHFVSNPRNLRFYARIAYLLRIAT